ncbi:GNAT family N-acetyltransferase [Anaerobacillus sp. CMMVII]|uniref:GNAT family N-acetyltransferase n=1 Tax=Anaerobacillus sp. CMMVII TaxID=2755588 RepID=UPI0021B82BB9|nr:GNAT family N-acetyltransferase [Anaerobacillus sp. CMMVII]MCT8137820.1 GNAT family N-acetyltransferase [Anaerobacillus sp. CMMVII]
MGIIVRQGEKESVFQAVDKKNNVVGTGWIIPAAPSDIYTKPRLDVYMTIEIDAEENQLFIKDKIFETLLNKAYSIKKGNQDKLVRVYHCCFSNARENIDYYQAKAGFRHDEGMYIIRKNLDQKLNELVETVGIKYQSLPLSSDAEILTLIDKHKTVFRNGYSIESINLLKQKTGWNSIAAIDDGEIIGNIMLFIEETPTRRIGWVEDLFVTKDWRNKGIAINLVNKGLRHFQDNSVEEVRIEVWSSNERAMSLYKQFGFEFYEETEVSIGIFL